MVLLGVLLWLVIWIFILYHSNHQPESNLTNPAITFPLAKYPNETLTKSRKLKQKTVALDKSGKPYKAGDFYISCINSPYYEEHIPAILKEISEMYHPEGFTDNSWSGLDRESICYCENCMKSFFDKTGTHIPLVKNWDDPVYKKWTCWNYDRRLEIWDLNNRVTKAAGGPLCIWAGMEQWLYQQPKQQFP